MCFSTTANKNESFLILFLLSPVRKINSYWKNPNQVTWKNIVKTKLFPLSLHQAEKLFGQGSYHRRQNKFVTNGIALKLLPPQIATIGSPIPSRHVTLPHHFLTGEVLSTALYVTASLRHCVSAYITASQCNSQHSHPAGLQVLWLQTDLGCTGERSYQLSQAIVQTTASDVSSCSDF